MLVLHMATQSANITRISVNDIIRDFSRGYDALQLRGLAKKRNWLQPTM
jgi:hypothetical protein